MDPQIPGIGSRIWLMLSQRGKTNITAIINNLNLFLFWFSPSFIFHWEKTTLSRSEERKQNNYIPWQCQTSLRFGSLAFWTALTGSQFHILSAVRCFSILRPNVYYNVSHGSPDLERIQSGFPLPRLSQVRRPCVGTLDDNEHYDLNISQKTGVWSNPRSRGRNSGELMADLHYLQYWISL